MIYDFKESSRSSHRMTELRIQEILDDLNKGLPISQIAKKHKCDRATIYYYKKKFNITAKQNFSPLSDFEEQELKRIERQVNCEHLIWIKKCSVCGAILESDRQVNTHIHAK